MNIPGGIPCPTDHLWSHVDRGAYIGFQHTGCAPLLGEAAAEMALEAAEAPPPPPSAFLGAFAPTLRAAPPSPLVRGIL